MDAAYGPWPPGNRAAAPLRRGTCPPGSTAPAPPGRAPAVPAAPDRALLPDLLPCRLGVGPDIGMPAAPFSRLAAAFLLPRLQCQPLRYPVQPTADGPGLTNGGRLASEQQEGGLKHVLGVLRVPRRMRRDTLNTIGPCRRTRTAKAASSCWRAKGALVDSRIRRFAEALDFAEVWRYRVTTLNGWFADLADTPVKLRLAE